MTAEQVVGYLDYNKILLWTYLISYNNFSGSQHDYKCYIDV